MSKLAATKEATGPLDCVANAEVRAAPNVASRSSQGMFLPQIATVAAISEIRALKIGLSPGSVNLPGYSGLYWPNTRWVAA
ncbi:hypothetical protein D3C71_735870 [compost metagenome]